MNYDEAKAYMKNHPEAWLDRDGSGEGFVCPLCGSGSGRKGTGLRKDPNSKDGTHWKCFGGEKCGFYGDMIQLAAECAGIVMPKYSGGVMSKEDTELYRDGFEAARTAFGIQVSPDGVYFAGKKKEARKAKYRVMLDATPGTQKPEGGAARKRSKEPERVGWYTLEDITETLCKGGTVQPCTGTYWVHPYKTNPKTGEPLEKFIGEKQQLIAKDFDNDHKENGVRVPNGKQITIEEALAICYENGFVPCLGYRTFSDPDYPYDKFRLVWALDRELDIREIGKNNYAKIDKLFVDMFDGTTDAAADGDLNRLFYGTNSAPFHYDDTAIVYVDEVIRRINLAAATETTTQDESVVEDGAALADSFLDTIYTEAYKPIPTGIKDLDTRLKGGVVNGWAVLMQAAPATGKTALTAQIMDYWAQQGRKCIYIALEMSEHQMLARSLSRILYTEFGVEMDALKILRGYEHTEPERQDVLRAKNWWRENIAPNMLYNPDDTGTDIDRIIESIERRAAIAEAKGEPAPIVALDYLQYVSSDNAREDDVKTIKRALQAIKDYAKNHNTIAFAITATGRAANKDAEKGVANMAAGRDTSNIEYTADLIIQLTKAVDDNKREIKNMVDLFVTKARFCEPSTTKPTSLFFNGAYSCFSDMYFQPESHDDLKGYEQMDMRGGAVKTYRKGKR